MDNVLNDIRYALRSLKNSPGFTLVVVLTLALGIGANATMFGIIDLLMFRPPKHVEDPGQLASIRFVSKEKVVTARDRRTVPSYPVYLELRQASGAFSEVAAQKIARISFGRGKTARQVHFALVTPSYFPLLGLKPVIGRVFTDAEAAGGSGASVALISYALWQEEFGGETTVLEKEIWLANKSYLVLGVLPNGFKGLETNSLQVWVPAIDGPGRYRHEAYETSRTRAWLQFLGRLRPGITTQDAERQTLHGLREVSPEFNRGLAITTIFDQRARITLYSRVFLWLAGASVLVLLVACINVTGLLLTRSHRQSHEFAVRAALGAGRMRLLRQVLTESLLLALAGGGLAFLVIFWMAELIRTHYLREEIHFNDFLDLRMLTFTAATVVLSGIVSGILPALRVTRQDVPSIIKTGGPEATPKNSRLHGTLIVSQVALSVLLLTGAGLFVRSLQKVHELNLGFDPDRTWIATLNLGSVGFNMEDATALKQRILERIENLPEIEQASIALSGPFFGGTGYSTFTLPGGVPPPGGPRFSLNMISPGYFATLGIPVHRGRDFTSGDTADSMSVIIMSQKMASSLWPGENPLGKCIEFRNQDEYHCPTVVGVVGDIRNWSLLEEPEGRYFFPLTQARNYNFSSFFFDSMGTLSILVKIPARARNALALLRQEIHAASPNLPYLDVRPLSAYVAVRTRRWRTGTTLFGLYGVLSLTLTAVGLFGILSFLVRTRTREIAIRSALGAQRRDLILMVARRAMTLVGLGTVIGLLGSFWLTRFLKNQLYGVTPTDPLTFASVSFLLLVVSLLACYVPARRATRVDPIQALRYE